MQPSDTSARYLQIDEIAPVVEVAGCFQLQDRDFTYRIPGHHLILIESGEIEARTPGGALCARPHDLLCFRPAERNEYSPRGSTLTYQAQILFHPPPLHQLTPWLDGIGPLPCQLALGAAFEPMRRVFEALCLELNRSGAASRLRVRAAVHEMLALVAEAASDGRSPAPHLDPWQRVRMRLHLDISKDISIAQLARQMGLTADHFIRRFRQRFGMSPKAYHTQARMLAAVRLLREGDKPVKAIAHRLGFSDANAFTRVFKRHVGVLPSELRSGASQPVPDASTLHGKLFALNQPIFPPHAGPDWAQRWRIRGE